MNKIKILVATTTLVLSTGAFAQTYGHNNNYNNNIREHSLQLQRAQDRLRDDRARLARDQRQGNSRVVAEDRRNITRDEQDVRRLQRQVQMDKPGYHR